MSCIASCSTCHVRTAWQQSASSASRPTLLRQTTCSSICSVTKWGSSELSTVSQNRACCAKAKNTSSSNSSSKPQRCSTRMSLLLRLALQVPASVNNSTALPNNKPKQITSSCMLLCLQCVPPEPTRYYLAATGHARSALKAATAQEVHLSRAAQQQRQQLRSLHSAALLRPAPLMVSA